MNSPSTVRFVEAEIIEEKKDEKNEEKINEEKTLPPNLPLERQETPSIPSTPGRDTPPKKESPSSKVGYSLPSAPSFSAAPVSAPAAVIIDIPSIRKKDTPKTLVRNMLRSRSRASNIST